MIKHVVMFKLKDEGSSAVRNKRKQELRMRLENLPSRINVIRSMEVGINTLESERAFDVVLISTFDNTEDLEHYRVHPDHQEVVRYLSGIREQTAAVDFEY